MYHFRVIVGLLVSEFKALLWDEIVSGLICWDAHRCFGAAATAATVLFNYFFTFSTHRRQEGFKKCMCDLSANYRKLQQGNGIISERISCIFLDNACLFLPAFSMNWLLLLLSLFPVFCTFETFELLFQGFERTAKQNFGGGNTAWEERKLSKYETRWDGAAWFRSHCSRRLSANIC